VANDAPQILFIPFVIDIERVLASEAFGAASKVRIRNDRRSRQLRVREPTAVDAGRDRKTVDVGRVWRTRR